MNAESLTAAWNEARKSAPSGWSAVRERGLQRFLEVGIPTPRHEDWKFTSLAPLRGFEPARGGNVVRALPADPARLVFEDGALISEIPGSRFAGTGLRVVSLAAAAGDQAVAERIGQAAADEDDAFTALNSAFLGSGLAIHVPNGHGLVGPLVILHRATRAGAIAHTRVQIVLADGASLDVIEQFEGPDGACFVNPVTEAFLGTRAALNHVRIADYGDQALHLGRLAVRQGQDSRLVSRHFAIGGQVSRCRVDVTLDHGATVDLTGLYLAGKGQLVDHHTTVDHAEPHGTTREKFRGVVDGGGRGVFTGRVIVRPHAQKTDAAQSVKNLLLDDDAVANARPQLEINADDVKCSHGAAVGRLDEESLFYLRSRGIGAAEARRILTYAFASEMLVGVEHEPARQMIEERVHAWLARMGGAA